MKHKCDEAYFKGVGDKTRVLKLLSSIEQLARSAQIYILTCYILTGFTSNFTDDSDAVAARGTMGISFICTLDC